MNALSLCIIVKNEENNLDKCLSSVTQYVDEIIVVDTGSTDKSKDIALKYTDKVFDFEWINDFSAARNFSLSKAKNDWILVMDADESVLAWNVISVNGFINNKKNNKSVGMAEIKSRIDSLASGETIHTCRIARVFNKKYSFYRGTIHEQIYVGGKAYAHMRQIDLDISFDHTGYMVAEVAKKDKRTRNRELLEKELEKHPDNPYVQYQLGKEYLRTNKKQRGIELLEASLSNPETISKAYGYDAVHCLGATYHEDRLFEKGVELKKYESFMGDSSDFCYIQGQMLFELGNFLEAALMFLKAIQNKSAASKGVDSYLALEAMGMCYQNMNQYEDALMFYEKAYKDHNYDKAKTRYDNLKHFLDTGQKN